MQLLSDEVLALIEAPDPPLAGIDSRALDDPEAGPSLRAYLTLTHWPQRFTSRGWAAEEVFWSRYYWFRRFVRLRVARFGPDAGLEQQALQILEAPEPECLPDWSHSEWVEALAERDAADQLRPPRSDAPRSGSHRIAEADVLRLARLAGVSDHRQWPRHLAEASRIPGLLAGDVREAWAACLPVWLEQGRVRDLARGLRVTRYWPSFASSLGNAFVARYWPDYPYLLELLERHPLDSAEHLCAYDLLVGVVHEFASRGLAVPGPIFAAGGPLPPVVRRELPWDRRQLDSVGESLARLHAEDYAPDDGDAGPASG